jgi:alkanesulfonate monooxygenase SsuD/methylene tetrahydromethanopterin reductase-like flavin-dependent oxidoreductase (luciferase family)
VLHRKDYSLPRHAECIFIGGDQPEKFVNKLIKYDYKQTARSSDEDAIKIFVGITVVVAETHELAQKLAEYRQYASPEAGLAHYASSVGIDLPSLQMMKRFLIKRAIALLHQ